jgi:hypothetical protein
MILFLLFLYSYLLFYMVCSAFLVPTVGVNLYSLQFKNSGKWKTLDIRYRYRSILELAKVCVKFCKAFGGISVADPDPGSGAFLPSGSGIRDGAMVGSGSGISRQNLLIAFIQK